MSHAGIMRTGTMQNRDSPRLAREKMEKEGRTGGVRTAAELIKDLQQVVKGAHIMPVDSVSLVDEVLNYSLD